MGVFCLLLIMASSVGNEYVLLWKEKKKTFKLSLLILRKETMQLSASMRKLQVTNWIFLVNEPESHPLKMDSL